MSEFSDIMKRVFALTGLKYGQDFALRIGISQTHCTRILHGTHIPGDDLIVRICKKLAPEMSKLGLTLSDEEMMCNAAPHRTSSALAALLIPPGLDSAQGSRVTWPGNGTESL